MNKPLPRSRFGAAFAEGYDRIFGKPVYRDEVEALASLGDVVWPSDGRQDVSSRGRLMAALCCNGRRIDEAGRDYGPCPACEGTGCE